VLSSCRVGRRKWHWGSRRCVPTALDSSAHSAGPIFGSVGATAATATAATAAAASVVCLEEPRETKIPYLGYLEMLQSTCRKRQINQVIVVAD
jgi:hypothetical protein